MKILSKKEIEKELIKVPTWRQNSTGSEIKKTFLFEDFKSTLRFVNRVGKEAEKMEHHPDITLSYGKAAVKLSTHSVKGLTDKDFKLAKVIDGQVKK